MASPHGHLCNNAQPLRVTASIFVSPNISYSQLSAFVYFRPIAFQPIATWGIGISVTVLIVEDNASVRRMLRRALASAATDIYECTDGEDALSSYISVHPDVVLMDVRMQRMDGIAATRQIISNYPNARIVMVTDYDEEEIRVAASEAGACGYALKQDLTTLATLVSIVAGPSA
jgi:CheY-like chemotaxis protein